MNNRQMMIDNTFSITGQNSLDVSVNNIKAMYALDSTIHQVY